MSFVIACMLHDIRSKLQRNSILKDKKSNPLQLAKVPIVTNVGDTCVISAPFSTYSLYAIVRGSVEKKKRKKQNQKICVVISEC